MNRGSVSMIVNKALIAAAVLLFTAPVVPALAHDDYGDRGYVRCLESVSKLDQGLQSFRSMRRMEASFKNARALRLRFSQSLASRRQRLSHAMVRSTIQRLGNCTNPLA